MKPFRFALLVSLIAGPLWACASTPWPPVPDHLQRITYEPEGFPFCGRCETTEVTIAEDGRIWVTIGFWGHSVWREQRRTIHSSPETYARFRDALAPYRPTVQIVQQSDGENCVGEYWADGGGGARVTWSGPTGSIYREFEGGCTADREMVAAVRAARAALPVRE